MKRPLLWGFLFLGISICIAYADAPIGVILVISLLLVISPVFLKTVKFSQIIFVLIIFLMGFALMDNAIKDLDDLILYEGQEFFFVGTIESYPEIEKNRKTFMVKTDRMMEDEISYDFHKRFNLSYYGDELKIFQNLKPGDQIEFYGIIQPLEGSRNPGGFNEKLYLKSKGIDGRIQLSGSDLKIIGNKTGFFERTMQVKKQMEDQLDQAFKADVAHLLKGILFGNKKIDQDIKTSFQTIGVGHILAVSGLHVGFLFLLLTFGLKKLRVKKAYWIIIIAPILFIYAVLTGFSASVLRASIMLCCLIIGTGWALEKDSLNNLLLAGTIILLIWPTQLFQAGFQLSMAAVLGIIFFNKPLQFQIEKRLDSKEASAGQHPILATVILTAAVLLGTLPITMYHFGNFTIFTFLANLIIIPVTAFFVMGGFLFLLSTALLKIALPFIVIPVTFLGDSLLVSSQAINHLNSFFDFLNIQNGSFDFLITGIFLMAGFFFAGYFKARKKWVKSIALGLASLLIILSFAANVIPGYLEVTMLDVGQGDSILIKSPSGDHYLIDGGGYQFESDYEISDRVLYPAFRQLNVKEFEAVFLSHNHEDHKQGIEELIEDDFPINHLFMGVQTNNTFLGDQKTVPVTLLKKGSTIASKDGLRIEVLYPDGEIKPKRDTEQNNASLVLLLSYQDVHMLFCGDMEKEAEQAILQEMIALTEKKDIQVLKVGHHGSKTSSTQAFVEAVAPELAMISVGNNNFYGHPNEEVIERFESRMIKVLRTDLNGAIALTSNGQWVRTKTYLN